MEEPKSLMRKKGKKKSKLWQVFIQFTGTKHEIKTPARDNFCVVIARPEVKSTEHD